MLAWCSNPPMRASLTIDWTKRGSSSITDARMRLIATRLVNPLGPGSWAS